MEDLLCEAEKVRCLAGARLEKVPDETAIPTSAAGWSATGWLACCFGRSGIRPTGGAEGGRHH